MTQLALLPQQRSDILKLDPRSIFVEEGFNVRQDYGDMESLTEQIAESGVRVPIRGYKSGDKFYITDGHRRHKACMILIERGIEIRIPFISERAPSAQSRLFDMFICNEGKKLTPIEQAELINRMINLGLKPKEISEKIGISTVTISNLLYVAKLPPRLKTRISNNEITHTLVLNELRSRKITAEDFEEEIEKILDPESQSTEIAQYSVDKEPAPQTKKKITAKDLQKINSFKNLKDFMKKMEEEGNRPTKNAQVYSFLMDIVENVLTDADIQEYFTAKA
jgi:ParB/RepB/Spo0J family partition protein